MRREICVIDRRVTIPQAARPGTCPREFEQPTGITGGLSLRTMYGTPVLPHPRPDRIRNTGQRSRPMERAIDLNRPFRSAASDVMLAALVLGSDARQAAAHAGHWPCRGSRLYGQGGAPALHRRSGAPVSLLPGLHSQRKPVTCLDVLRGMYPVRFGAEPLCHTGSRKGPLQSGKLVIE